MGYMTTITILNDAYDAMEKNKEEFFDNISIGMNGHTRHTKGFRRINCFGIGNYCNYMYVAQSNHANEDRLYLVGGNTMDTFGYANDEKDIEWRKKRLKRAKEILKYEAELIKELEQKKTK